MIEALLFIITGNNKSLDIGELEIYLMTYQCKFCILIRKEREVVLIFYFISIRFFMENRKLPII